MGREEARTSTRHAIDVRVDLRSDDTFFTGFSENISEGGLFVATAAPLRVGDRLVVALSLMGTGPLRLSAVVRWVRGKDARGGLPPGAGLQFVDPAPEAAAAIEAFLRSGLKDTLFYELR
jgi:uncharacterized protein (TIGR02266 family)